MTAQRDRVRLVVCRGCCCGTPAKHPGIDHDSQVTRLAATSAAIAVTGCLGHCETSNNIVVIPSLDGRRRGGKVVWLGHLLHPELTGAVAQWADAGGPGIAAIPETLASQQISPHSQVPAPRPPAGQPDGTQDQNWLHTTTI